MSKESLTENPVAVAFKVDGKIIDFTRKLDSWGVPLEWAVVEDGKVSHWLTTTHAINAVRRADLLKEDLCIMQVAKVTEAELKSAGLA